MIGKEEPITPPAGLRIRKTGTFNLNKLYKDMRMWFNKYSYDFQEKEYKRKDADAGQEIKITWVATKEIDDYCRSEIKVEFFLQYVMDIGNSLKKGFLQIKFWAKVILDYQNKWQAKPLGNFLFFMYNNFIIKNKIEKYYEGQLYNELIELQDLTKSLLKE